MVAAGRDEGSMVAEETVAVAAAAAERASVHSVEEAELGRGEAEAVVVGILEGLLARVVAPTAADVTVAEEGWEEVATDTVDMVTGRLVAEGREASAMGADGLAEVVGEAEALEAEAMVVEAGVEVEAVVVEVAEVEAVVVAVAEVETAEGSTAAE